MTGWSDVPAAASPPTESPLQYSPALPRVTTGFGMGPGGATALSATGTSDQPGSCLRSTVISDVCQSVRSARSLSTDVIAPTTNTQGKERNHVPFDH